MESVECSATVGIRFKEKKSDDYVKICPFLWYVNISQFQQDFCPVLKLYTTVVNDVKPFSVCFMWVDVF